MVTATKKNASIALIVVAFATIMMTASLATNIRSVYAWGHGGCGFGCGGCGGCGFDPCGGCGGWGFDGGCGGCGFGGFGGFGGWDGFGPHHTHQSIDQGCIQPTRSSAFGGFDHGFGTPVNGQPGNGQGGALSHNNVVTCVNANFGGNAAVNGEGGFR